MGIVYFDEAGMSEVGMEFSAISSSLSNISNSVNKVYSILSSSIDFNNAFPPTIIESIRLNASNVKGLSDRLSQGVAILKQVDEQLQAVDHTTEINKIGHVSTSIIGILGGSIIPLRLIHRSVKESFFDEIDQGIFTTSDIYRNAEKVFKNLPSDVRSRIEDAVGKDEMKAIGLLGDVLKGDVSFDTLKKGLKLTGMDGTTSSVISESIKVTVNGVFDEQSTLRFLLEGQDMYMQSAMKNFADGRIIDGLSDLGMSVATVGGIMLYGTEEVTSNIVAGMVDGVIGKPGEAVGGFIEAVGEIIPGSVGELVSDIGKGVTTVATGIGDWIRNWVQ